MRLKGACSLSHEFIQWREMYFDIQANDRDWQIQDETFYFRYKDGTVIIINHMDSEESVKSVDLRKVIYICVDNADDGYDSHGKSWSIDFKQDTDSWNEYRNSKLYN